MISFGAPSHISSEPLPGPGKPNFQPWYWHRPLRLTLGDACVNANTATITARPLLSIKVPNLGRNAPTSQHDGLKDHVGLAQVGKLNRAHAKIKLVGLGKNQIRSLPRSAATRRLSPQDRPATGLPTHSIQRLNPTTSNFQLLTSNFQLPIYFRYNSRH